MQRLARVKESEASSRQSLSFLGGDARFLPPELACDSVVDESSAIFAICERGENGEREAKGYPNEIEEKGEKRTREKGFSV